ncbi:MAG: N-acetylneuraminate synthase family protein [Desulfobacterales bacterium]|jgi:N-acetylneuraminate synthase
MASEIKLGSKCIGTGNPVFIIGEIGINHNGDIDIAKKLIDVAAFAGLDAVKFQKRTPELCVPEEQKNLMRETPWGIMSYMDYRYRVEFETDAYAEIDDYCREKGILWFASCWDEPSVDFIEQFEPPCFKIASAAITNDQLIAKHVEKERPLVLSTGMSSMDEIDHTISRLDPQKMLLAHCTSSYPCIPEELNLRMIETLQSKYNCPVGYSGHEVGLQTTYAAVVLGACFIERHITLDRAMWGSDQAASVEPAGLMRLVRDIRIIEKAMGDGIKKVYASEQGMIKRLRLG